MAEFLAPSDKIIVSTRPIDQYQESGGSRESLPAMPVVYRAKTHEPLNDLNVLKIRCVAAEPYGPCRILGASGVAEQSRQEQFVAVGEY
jgi:hypothetical protein